MASVIKPVSVVVSQPMFFPWVGMFEQVRLADIYVHYGDVQFSKGSFVNRVQIKTAQGMKWLTVPLEKFSLGQSIDEVQPSSRINWRGQHLNLLNQAYAESPYIGEMMDLVSSVYGQSAKSIGELSGASLKLCNSYYGLNTGRQFVDVRDLGIGGSSSRRVLDVVKILGGHKYITGLGAHNYLDHQLFESANIRVEYMNYQKIPYPQLHGEFTPYVSILDLIANVGRHGMKYIGCKTVYWKDYLHHE